MLIPSSLTINRLDENPLADPAPCNSLPHPVFKNFSLKATGEFGHFVGISNLNLLGTCSKCCPFLHHSSTSVDQLPHTQASRLKFGFITPWHEEREKRQEVTKMRRERKNKGEKNEVRNVLVRDKDLLRRWKQKKILEKEQTQVTLEQYRFDSCWSTYMHISLTQYYTIHDSLNMQLLTTNSETADMEEPWYRGQVWAFQLCRGLVPTGYSRVNYILTVDDLVPHKPRLAKNNHRAFTSPSSQDSICPNQKKKKSPRASAVAAVLPSEGFKGQACRTQPFTWGSDTVSR